MLNNLNTQAVQWIAGGLFFAVTLFGAFLGILFLLHVRANTAAVIAKLWLILSNAVSDIVEGRVASRGALLLMLGVVGSCVTLSVIWVLAALYESGVLQAPHPVAMVLSLANPHFDAERKATMDDAMIYQFWTPSEETWAYITNHWENYSVEERSHLHANKALYACTKEEVDSFNFFIASNCQGYNTFESMGKGTAPIKPGKWYRVTVTDRNSLNLTNLIQNYSRCFHRTNGIYVEQARIQFRR